MLKVAKINHLKVKVGMTLRMWVAKNIRFLSTRGRCSSARVIFFLFTLGSWQEAQPWRKAKCADWHCGRKLLIICHVT